jgi:hypothetical protein
MTGEALAHAHVLAAGQAAAQRMGTLLRTVLPRVGRSSRDVHPERSVTPP